MADKKNDLMMAPKSGVIHDLVVRLKLILGLMGDNRVNFLLKALPVASLAYLFWPVDLISVIPGLSALDDVAIVSLGAYLFVELCPPGVVQEPGEVTPVWMVERRRPPAELPVVRRVCAGPSWSYEGSVGLHVIPLSVENSRVPPEPATEPVAIVPPPREQSEQEERKSVV